MIAYFQDLCRIFKRGLSTLKTHNSNETKQKQEVDVSSLVLRNCCWINIPVGTSEDCFWTVNGASRASHSRKRKQISNKALVKICSQKQHTVWFCLTVVCDRFWRSLLSLSVSFLVLWLPGVVNFKPAVELLSAGGQQLDVWRRRISEIGKKQNTETCTTTKCQNLNSFSV